MRFVNVILGLAVVGGSSFAAAVRPMDFSASGISMPFFDEAGRLTHKLIAAQGTKSGTVHTLHDVEVRYFAASDPNLVVQKLQAADALWDERKETLVGGGAIAVTTEESQLSGEGFDFALATSLLHIHRRFTMTNREVVMTSERAVVELMVERAGDKVKVRDVKRCEAVGQLEIVVQPTATREYRFEKAYSEIAIYDGGDQTVTLPRPIRTIRNGREGPELNKLQFSVKRGVKPPPE